MMRRPTRTIVERAGSRHAIRRLIVDGYDLDPEHSDADETSDEPWCYRQPRRA
jgi:hypothetical protein